MLSREKTCRLRKEPDSPPMRLSGAAGLRRGGAGALVSARPSGWAAVGPLLQGWLEAPLLKADWPSTGRVDTHCTALPVPALAGAAQHQRPGTGRDARWPRPMAGAFHNPWGGASSHGGAETLSVTLLGRPDKGHGRGQQARAGGWSFHQLGATGRTSWRWPKSQTNRLASLGVAVPRPGAARPSGPCHYRANEGTSSRLPTGTAP